MKKLILLALMTIVLALTIGQAAFAENCEAKVCEMVTKNVKVTEAQCVIYQRCCIVAIKTEKFTSKKEYEAFVKEVTEQIKAECEVDHVFVTRNPKVMAKINALANKSEEEREEIIKQLLDKEIIKNQPDDKFVFPKRTYAEQ